MTQRFTNNLPDISIQAGQSLSNVLDAYGSFSDCETFTLFCNLIDAAKTYTIVVSPDGTNWYNWNDGSSNILPPSTVNTASTYGNPGCRFVAIQASGNLASIATWKMQTSYYE